MAKTVTRTGNRVQPQAEVEPEVEIEEEVETKEQETVVVNPALAKLCTGWAQADRQQESYYPRIIWHVIANDTGKKEVKAALKEFRGMEEGAALNNAVSHIMRLKEHPDEVKACRDHAINPETEKEWTVRDLLKVGVEKRDTDQDSNDEKLHKLLQKTAAFAVNEVRMGLKAFMSAADSAYKEAHAKRQGEEVKQREAAAIPTRTKVRKAVEPEELEEGVENEEEFEELA